VANRTKSAVQQRAVNILRIIARAFGGIAIIFFLIIIFGYIAEDGLNVDLLFIMIPIALAITAFTVSWWRELLGGILMLAAYLLLVFSPSIHSLIYKESLHFYSGMFIYGSPFLVSGILYIVTFWFDQHYDKAKNRLEGKKLAS
jgi:hypothetical protein